MTPAIFAKFLNAFKNQPNGIPGLNANGDLVGPIVPRTGTLAALQLLAGSPGEVASATDVAAIVKYTGVAGEAQTFYQPPYGLRNAVIPTIPGFIGSNTTVTIGTGKNFAGMDAFGAFIEQCVVDENVTITLKCDRGVHTPAIPSAGKTWPHILLVSDQPYADATITGVSISAAGAAGAWTLTLTKTGLADTLLGVGGANQPTRLVCISDGTAGTNPDNAVGVYQGVTRSGASADTITLTSTSTLTAMPSAGATCTLYAPSATLEQIQANGTSSGNIRSIGLGDNTYAPVAVADLNIAGQKVFATSANSILLTLGIPQIADNTYNATNIYCQSFAPISSRFLQDINLITDGFLPIDCGNINIAGGFLINQVGVELYACENTVVGFTGATTVINTLGATDQLTPSKGGIMIVQPSILTINGTVVSGANLANYTALTPGTLSATAGFIYAA